MPEEKTENVLLKSGVVVQMENKVNALNEKVLFYDLLEASILNARRAQKALAVLYVIFSISENGKIYQIKSSFTNSWDVLASAEKRISETLGKSDDVAWIGLHECLVLSRDLQNMRAVEAAADRVLHTVMRSSEAAGAKYRISASIGCAVYPADGGSAKTLICNANSAAYRAKKEGEDIVVFYSDATDDDIRDELALTNDIYYSLERNELELHYQPQIDSSSGRIVGLEALLRWNHPERGRVSPVRFIPIAEKTGLITQIGKWSLKNACRQNKNWQDGQSPKIPVAVNLSARQFEHEDMMEVVGRILEETGLPAKYLELEITENTAIKELNSVAETLRQLKGLGVGIAVDDFGTAYSSLNYIKRLPVDKIKIDKCFIDGIGVSAKDEKILKTVIMLIQDLGMKAVAEGVETKR